MLKKELIELNQEIKHCEYFRSDNLPCKHNNKEAAKIYHPIIHVPLQESQTILIISQSPSRDTDSCEVDKNINLPSNFRCRIYSLIFFGKDNKEYMDTVKNNYKKINEIFSKYFYWVHYFKCYPGKAKGGDKSPNKFCANKYLKKEIELFQPKLVLTLGNLTKKYLYNIPLTCEQIHSLHPSPAATGYRKKYNFDEVWGEYKEMFKHYFESEDLVFISGLSKNTF